MRLFFLRKEDGWFETGIEGKLKNASAEELVMWAYDMMDRNHYINYLLTENPGYPESLLRRILPDAMDAESSARSGDSKH